MTHLFLFMYWKFRKWVYIYTENPLKTYLKARKVFKPLRLYFRCGRTWGPNIWCSKPAPIQIMVSDVGWKDKYRTPRFEYAPYIWIHLFGFNLIWYWSVHPHQQSFEDDYWEQLLWYLYYQSSPSIKDAKRTWPWQDCDTKKSSWKDEFIKQDKL